MTRIPLITQCDANVLMMTRSQSTGRLRSRPLFETLLTFKFQLDYRVSIWNCGFFHYVHYVKCWDERVASNFHPICALCRTPRMLKGKIFKLDCCRLIQFTRYWWWTSTSTRLWRNAGEWDQNEAEKKASTLIYILYHLCSYNDTMLWRKTHCHVPNEQKIKYFVH